MDQQTGEDLNPTKSRNDFGGEVEDDTAARNPDRPTTMPLIKDMPELDERNERKVMKRVASPEKWELKQMRAANVLPYSEDPDFDEQSGLLPKEDESDEDVEIEIVEDDPPFLKGHGRTMGLDLSPVKIVKVCRCMNCVN